MSARWSQEVQADEDDRGLALSHPFAVEHRMRDPILTEAWPSGQKAARAREA